MWNWSNECIMILIYFLSCNKMEIIVEQNEVMNFQHISSGCDQHVWNNMKSNTFLDNKGLWSLLLTIHRLIWSQPRCPHCVSLLALSQTFPAIRTHEEGNSHTEDICSSFFVIFVGVSWLCLQYLLHIVCQIFPDMEKEIKGTMEEYQKLLLESHLAIEKLSKRKGLSTT